MAGGVSYRSKQHHITDYSKYRSIQTHVSVDLRGRGVVFKGKGEKKSITFKRLLNSPLLSIIELQMVGKTFQKRLNWAICWARQQPMGAV